MMNSKAVWQKILQLQVLWNRKRTGEEVSLAGRTAETEQISSQETLPLNLVHKTRPSQLTLTCLKQQPHSAVKDCLDSLGLSQLPGRNRELGLSLLTLHCSASVRRTSVEAEPSLRNRPRVSFSRHMSRMALAVFPVSFREWTNTSTYGKITV